MATKLLIKTQICLLLGALTLVQVSVVAQAKSTPKLAMPNCNDTCGGMEIPYPFGMGASNCFFNEWFKIDCRASPSNHTNKLKPFLSELNVEVMNIGLDGTLEVRLPPLNMCSSTTSYTQSGEVSRIDWSLSPYSFSLEHNVLMMEGCPGSAVLVNQSSMFTAGCGTVCPDNNNNAIPTNSCFGVNCCQTPLLTGTIDSYNPSIQSLEIMFYPESSAEVKSCLVATFVEYGHVNKYVGKLSSSDLGSFPLVYMFWNWPKSLGRPQHYRHSICDQFDNGWQCSCGPNFDGNPYVPDGCQGPKECEDCRGDCLNQRDSSGNEISNKYYCEKGPLLPLAALLGLSNSLGFLVLVACVYGLYRFIKRRIEIKRKAKFFKRNGGLLLQQQLLSNEGVVEKTKIFTISELDKATDHFNENRILGQGGQGTVYKGMLTDGNIVAIKKAKLLDESQLEQFINEVVILSRISHRHVVKLYGCCLETEVPLLVYEFIPNGTLFQHIHDPEEDFAVTWKMRLKIAADSASAIAYLHSSATIPIYHRDIKSLNILLDEKYRAKVSDFGSSKTIAMDQTHLTTLVQGTMGYLDPEYFQSYQFTEKSDVYSFGVVILELLTSMKPIYREGSTMEQKNLVTEFLFLTQSSRLSNILDPKIVEEAKENELNSVIELAKRCVSWSGKLRPTMKEVAMALEMIMKFPGQVSSWYQQQEDIPIQYAGYDEFDMGGVSDTEFVWSTHLTGAASPPCGDEHPFLPDFN